MINATTLSWQEKNPEFAFFSLHFYLNMNKENLQNFIMSSVMIDKLNAYQQSLMYLPDQHKNQVGWLGWPLGPGWSLEVELGYIVVLGNNQGHQGRGRSGSCLGH